MMVFRFSRSYLVFIPFNVWRFLLFGIFIGLFVFTGAVTWVGNDVDYHINEDDVYYHDLRLNITGFDSDITFAIDTQTDINWTNASGSYFVEASVVSSWLSITDSVNGNLTINADSDNETGFFVVPIQANNASGDDTITNFEFQINATNDIPTFTNLNSTLIYNFPQSESRSYTINALDEEEHYPLTFNLTFLDNCTHALWSGRTDGENCSIFGLTGTTSTSTDFDFNPGLNDVGTYWANFSVSDLNGVCPHSYCDSATYNGNKSSGVYVLKFNVYSSLSINASNCSGSIFENETLNCTINVTTLGESDSLDFSSLSNLTTRDYVGNKSWVYSDTTHSSSGFFYTLNISIVPEKKYVGNWTVSINVDDGSGSESDSFILFVDIIESNVSLNAIDSISIYESASINVNATDNDLLVQDFNVKRESLVFSTNETTQRISVSMPSEDHTKNHVVPTLLINHSAFLDTDGEGNYSVNVTAVDLVGNLDWKVFNIEILNETAPGWNFISQVDLELIEGDLFYYNVSVNVSDEEDDPISFYYENVSGEFCSLNSTNFNSSSGIINFTPIDCDVGEHIVNIIANDGKLNSSWSFNFSVSNIVDLPLISSFTGDNGTQVNLDEGASFALAEGASGYFSLLLADDDFLIPSGQESYYNESFIINTTFTNSTGGTVNLFNFSFLDEGVPADNNARYNATFVPGVEDVGNYVVFVDAIDASGARVNRTWFLNISEVLDPPVLGLVSNSSLTIHDVLNFSLNATDDEDDYSGLDLNYSAVPIDTGAPNLNVAGDVVSFNMSSNQSLSGAWRYNISVNDSDGMIDWQVYWVFVYGFAENVSLLGNFSLTENVSSVLNFTINHSVGDSLVYEFWIDNVSCAFQDNSDCSYSAFSFRESVVGYGNGSFLNWTFAPGFLDETYGLMKNLTVKVYPNSSLLNSSQRESVATNFSFDLNVSHTNAPMRAIADIGLLQTDYNSNINLDLESYFRDEDVSDSYWMQNSTFTKYSQVSGSDIYLTQSNRWDVLIGTTLKSVHSDFISISGSDNVTSDIITGVEVSFVAPTTTPAPSGGSGGSSTKLKFYSLRIIVPEDVIISDDNYIEIPFGVENYGTIDLKRINLSSEVLYNNMFADDVNIELEDTYIDLLKAGEKREYTMKILADTDRSGKYKATIFANVSSPKFSDWGDFFIDLRRTNESEAEELLIFTEKIISDNPECLELTEVFRRAKEMFENGDDVGAIKLAEEISAACEDAISINEQVRYRIEGFVERNLYYISFITLMIFFIGFIFYVYRRVRFNKYREDDYVR